MGKGFAKQKKQMKLFQQQFSQIQNQMENLVATGTAGNGLVTIIVDGHHNITKITIKPECVDPQDVEGLEDLIKQAYNNANTNLDASLSQNNNLPNLPLF